MSACELLVCQADNTNCVEIILLTFSCVYVTYTRTVSPSMLCITFHLCISYQAALLGYPALLRIKEQLYIYVTPTFV